jgi:hypothetical protein
MSAPRYISLDEAASLAKLSPEEFADRAPAMSYHSSPPPA